ncbi:unnamed protein product [Rangifer tarandus platyrhynchus]|uniref:Uncharacterized protein n=1 Tax=Rangifer tarandus platyrhynchus TaxID=3082113 RepID=A0AC59ZWN5_RANTA
MKYTLSAHKRRADSAVAEDCGAEVLRDLEACSAPPTPPHRAPQRFPPPRAPFPARGAVPDAPGEGWSRSVISVHRTHSHLEPGSRAVRQLGSAGGYDSTVWAFSFVQLASAAPANSQARQRSLQERLWHSVLANPTCQPQERLLRTYPVVDAVAGLH